jgi:general secretion pathway protein F
MANFRYNATDAEGRWVSGEAEGVTFAEVEARLAAEGLRVESMIEAEKGAGADGPAGPGEWVELAEQLESLTRSGLPLPSGLRAAGQEMISPRLRATFLGLADRLETGANLGAALRSNRQIPAPIQGLVVAGARSGRLADLLGEYVRAANIGAELRRLFWSTLVYPLVALTLVLGLVYGVCIVSTRLIEWSRDGLNLAQAVAGPRGGRDRLGVLIVVARFISDHGLEVAIGLALVPIAAWATLRFAMSASRARRVVCSAPVVGPILRFASLAEFCHLLAMLIEAETPLPKAIELAGQGVGDADVAEASARMGQAIEEGQPLSDALRLWTSVPAGLGQLFAWSEARRGLPDSLHLAGDMFEARARAQSTFAAGILATLIMLMVVWWIGFAVAVLFLPMLSTISALSG